MDKNNAEISKNEAVFELLYFSFNFRNVVSNIFVGIRHINFHSLCGCTDLILYIKET